MRKLIALMVLLTINISILHAQKKVFVRVYDMSGKKTAKGFLAGTTDSSILISRDTLPVSIPVTQIGYIKTKRSAGHTILISSLTGAVVCGIIGAASGEPPVNDNTFGGTLHDALTFTPGEAFVVGFILGAGAGAGIGAVIYGVGKHYTFEINGKLENFQQQRELINTLLVK
jgi:hypothetical protein